jgi:hypothetical protein
VAGLVAVLLLQDHLVGDFATRGYLVPRSYRAWRDPAALLCLFASIAAAVRIARGGQGRLELALGVMGCAFAAAVYVDQQGANPWICPPGYHCPINTHMFRPDLWHNSHSVLIVAVGLAVAVVLMLPRSWIAAPAPHLRRG